MALELTETEKRVLEAARTGKVALLAGSRTDDPTTGNTPSVRAQALAEILSAPDLAPLGLRIAGATITGQLDIGERSVQWPVIIERCKFHELIVAKNARIPELAIVESQLPGLIAPYLHVTYALSLSGTRIGPGPVAVDLVDACIGEALFNQGFEALGEVRLNGAEIRGRLDASGGHFTNNEGNALSCDGAEVRGSAFFGDGFEAQGGVREASTVNLSDVDALRPRSLGRCLRTRRRPSTSAYPPIGTIIRWMPVT